MPSIQSTCARFPDQPIIPGCLGEQRTAVGYRKESEPKRRRLSVNKGTREARLSMVVTKHLPMRQPSGGAPVVVRDVNDVHMAKGCRMICVRITKVFFNLEGSK